MKKTVASETIRRVDSSNKNIYLRRTCGKRLFFRISQELETRKFRLFKVCKGPRGVWRCKKFKELVIQQRWDTVIRLSLCFRCLGVNHCGQTCTRPKICGIKNCRDTRHRLLHVDKSLTDTSREDQTKTGTTPHQNRAAQSLPNTQREPKPGIEGAQVVLLPLRNRMTSE